MINKLKNTNVFFLITLMIVWRIFLIIPQIIGQFILREHPGYIGPSMWANLDGVHYLSIAGNGYHTYEQAFFPLFPLLIYLLSFVTHLPILLSAFLIVNLSLFFALYFLYKLALVIN